MDSKTLTVVVRGIGDIGSAVAHRLFLEGYAIVIHDVPTPTTTRRGMAVADAVFDGSATLENVHAVRAHDLPRIREALASRRVIPVYVRDIAPLLAEMRPEILVDARMRKHAPPEVQRGLAELTVGLGPSLVSGDHADVVIETCWAGLGTIVATGASAPLAGEPRELAGHARDRYVYAPLDGIFRTKRRIGDLVRQGQAVRPVMQAFEELRGRFDVVVCEGAGSPAEINLRANDLANMGLARAADIPVVLVGDIDRGGVFPSLYGTLALLEPADQRLIAGFVINKFRGDPGILAPGLDTLEALTGRTTYAVLPWLDGPLHRRRGLAGAARAAAADGGARSTSRSSGCAG